MNLNCFLSILRIPFFVIHQTINVVLHKLPRRYPLHRFPFNRSGSFTFNPFFVTYITRCCIETTSPMYGGRRKKALLGRVFLLLLWCNSYFASTNNFFILQHHSSLLLWRLASVFYYTIVICICSSTLQNSK